MANRGLFLAGVLTASTALLVIAPGCSAREDNALPDARWQEAVAGEPLEQPPGRLRLTRLYGEQARTAPVEPLELGDPAQWDAPDTVTIAEADGRFRVEEVEDGGSILRYTGSHEAWRFNVLRVRMRTEEAGSIRVGWRSSADRIVDEDTRSARRLYPGEDFQTYVFPLYPRHAKTWTGWIEELELVPNDSGGVSEIESIELAFDPHAHPAGENLDGKTMEALDFQNFDWRFMVTADDLPAARPELVDYDPELPVLYLWYGKRTGEQTEAEALSDEAQAELEALGYL